MTTTIRWGILSTANIARKRVVPAIQAAHNSEVVAVASRHADRAQAFATELNIPRAYGSYEALLGDPDIDAIYIGLPNNLHAEWAIHCATAGKPTLCEKPLALDAAQAQQMVTAFAARNVPFAEAFMYRFHPQTERVRALLAEGVIGELHAIDAVFTFRLPPEASENIRLQPDLGGGSLMDVGCYCVNLMRLMTDAEPEAVTALARMGAQSGVDEAFAGVLRFPGGVLGHFDSGLRSIRTHRYELRGATGRIVVPQGFVMEAHEQTTIEVVRGEAVERVVIPAANHYQRMAEDFAHALLDDRPPRFAPEDAVANMRVLDQLRAAL